MPRSWKNSVAAIAIMLGLFLPLLVVTSPYSLMLNSRRWKEGWYGDSTPTLTNLLYYPLGILSTTSTTSTVTNAPASGTAPATSTAGPSPATSLTSTSTATPTTSTTLPTTTTPDSVQIGPADFHIFSSCSSSSSTPSVINNTIVLPYAPTVPNGCPYDLNDAHERAKQQLHDFSFTGTFVTDNIGATSYGFDEEVVASVDDMINWTGQEYGFRTQLKDGIIYGYVQDGTKLADGYTYFYSVPLMKNDNMQHNFLVAESSTGTSNKFAYYVDGILKDTISHDSSYNYSSQSYRLLLTTHRWENGWDSGNSTMYVKNVSIR